MIKQTIDQDIKSAMLSGDKTLANALRTIKSAILDVEVNQNKRDTGLTDVESVAILQKELKKRTEAALLYDQGGNTESAASERYEETIIQKYLPKQLDEAEIRLLVEKAVADYEGELGNQAMGKIIGAVKQASGGAADGGLVARLVKEKLN